jgi:hypothetical protein
MALTSRKEVVVRAIAGWTGMAGVGQGASVRGWCVHDGVLEPLAEDFVGQISFSEPAHAKGNAPLALEVPWRRGAMRVVITDCLWPGDPGAWLNVLAREASQAVLLLPYAAEESDPEWSGGVEMKDCETGVERLQRVDRQGAEQYRRAYREHFRLWAEEARRRGVLTGRISCADGLSEAFANEGFIAGVVEPR